MKHWNRGFGLGLSCFGEQTHRSGKACCSANSDATKLTRLSCEPTLVVDPQELDGKAAGGSTSSAPNICACFARNLGALIIRIGLRSILFYTYKV